MYAAKLLTLVSSKLLRTQVELAGSWPALTLTTASQALIRESTWLMVRNQVTVGKVTQITKELESFRMTMPRKRLRLGLHWLIRLRYPLLRAIVHQDQVSKSAVLLSITALLLLIKMIQEVMMTIGLTLMTVSSFLLDKSKQVLREKSEI